MSLAVERFTFCDPIWSALRAQASELAESEPSLASLAHATILNHEQLEDALSYHLARKIGSEELSAMQTREVFDHSLRFQRELFSELRALRSRWGSAPNPLVSRDGPSSVAPSSGARQVALISRRGR